VVVRYAVLTPNDPRGAALVVELTPTEAFRSLAQRITRLMAGVGMAVVILFVGVAFVLLAVDNTLRSAAGLPRRSAARFDRKTCLPRAMKAARAICSCPSWR